MAAEAVAEDGIAHFLGRAEPRVLDLSDVRESHATHRTIPTETSNFLAPANT